MLTYLLLVAAQAPAVVPQFDVQAIKAYCAAKYPDEIADQFDCVRDQIEQHNRFTIHLALDEENRSDLIACLPTPNSDKERLDWSAIVGCADDLISVEKEEEQHPDSFTAAWAKNSCQKVRNRNNIEVMIDCIQDQAASHHSFNLMKLAVQKGYYKIDQKYVQNCQDLWVHPKDEYVWIMAEYCLTKQFGGDYFLKIMK